MRDKEQGVQFGKTKKLRPEHIAELQQRRQEGALIKRLMKEYNLSKSSVYPYLNEMISLPDSASCALQGANFIGSPDEIIEKILYQHEIFGHQRLLLQFTIGTMPHEKVMRAIELFGTEVAPVVREEIGRRIGSG